MGIFEKYLSNCQEKVSLTCLCALESLIALKIPSALQSEHEELADLTSVSHSSKGISMTHQTKVPVG